MKQAPPQGDCLGTCTVDELENEPGFTPYLGRSAKPALEPQTELAFTQDPAFQKPKRRSKKSRASDPVIPKRAWFFTQPDHRSDPNCEGCKDLGLCMGHGTRSTPFLPPK